MHPCKQQSTVAVLAMIVVVGSLVLVSGQSSYAVQEPQPDPEPVNIFCNIPCTREYVPVCGSHPGDVRNGGAEEVQQFANKCSMDRFNCENNKRFRLVEEERCAEENNDLEATMVPSGAASMMKMHWI